MLEKVKKILAEEWDLEVPDGEIEQLIEHFGLKRDEDIPDFIKMILGIAGIDYESPQSQPEPNNEQINLGGEDIKTALLEQINAKVLRDANEIVETYTGTPEAVQNKVLNDLVEFKTSRMHQHIPTGLDEFRQIASYSQIFHENVYLSQLMLNRILGGLAFSFFFLVCLTMIMSFTSQKNDQPNTNPKNFTVFDINRAFGR